MVVRKLSIQEDHIHIIIQTDLMDNVAEIVQRSKGGTSHVIRKDFSDLEEFLRRDRFWTDRYFAETVGNFDEDVVK